MTHLLRTRLHLKFRTEKARSLVEEAQQNGELSTIVKELSEAVIQFNEANGTNHTLVSGYYAMFYCGVPGAKAPVIPSIPTPVPPTVTQQVESEPSPVANPTSFSVNETEEKKGVKIEVDHDALDFEIQLG